MPDAAQPTIALALEAPQPRPAALAAPPDPGPRARSATAGQSERVDKLRRLGDRKPSAQRHPGHIRRHGHRHRRHVGQRHGGQPGHHRCQRTPDSDGFRRHIRHRRLSGRPLAAEHPVPQRRRHPGQRHHPNGSNGSPAATLADRRTYVPECAVSISARQIIFPEGLPAGITLIPTAGISVPTPGTEFNVTQYVSFMSVTQWGAPGQWTTNYSAIAYSEDNGEMWNVAPQTVRYNQSWTGNQNFQQSAFVRPGDGYVYYLRHAERPAGRRIRVARCREGHPGPDQVRLLQQGFARWVVRNWSNSRGVVQEQPRKGHAGLRTGHRGVRGRQSRQPGQRDVGAVQQVAQEVRRALRRPVQQHRHAHGHPPGARGRPPRC